MTNSRETFELVQRSQQGDRAAFDTLVEVCRDSLLGVLRARTSAELRQNTDVEDLFQETVIRALKAIERFHWQGQGSFSRWLNGIGSNVVRETVRKSRRAPAVQSSLELPRADEATPGQKLRREERFNRLQKALQKLSPDHRTVILLARVEELKIREIAERMDRSESAVKNLLLRALRALRENFGDTESLHLPPRSLHPDYEVESPQP